MREHLYGAWGAMPTPWQVDGVVDTGVLSECKNLIERDFPELAAGQFVLPTQEQA